MLEKALACIKILFFAVICRLKQLANFVRRCFMSDLFSLIADDSIDVTKKLELVKFRIENLGVDPNIKGQENNTPLHLAVRKNQIEVVKYLVTQKADVNALNVLSSTPMHLAVFLSYRPIVKFLIEALADVNLKDRYEDIPLHLAVRKNNLLIVKDLVEAGSKIEEGDSFGLTALGLAVSLSRLEIVKFLINNGSDVNSKDMLGYTPLQILVSKKDFKYQDIEIAKKLIASGAKTTVRTDRQGLIDLAWKNNKVTIVKFLEGVLTNQKKSLDQSKSDSNFGYHQEQVMLRGSDSIN